MLADIGLRRQMVEISLAARRWNAAPAPPLPGAPWNRCIRLRCALRRWLRHAPDSVATGFAAYLLVTASGADMDSLRGYQARHHAPRA
jgi:hypothetical protein